MALITRKFSDLNLRFTLHPITKDVSKLLNEQAIKESVKNLVLTKHYERPFHPEIGSSVTALLFENITPITAISIQKAIEDVIVNFEPRVQLLSVDVLVNPSFNAYNATIVFKIVNQPAPLTLDLILERNR